MYNRYIPQPDGSFRRSAVPDRQQPPRPRPQERPVHRPQEPACPTPEPPPKKPERCPHREPPPAGSGSSIGSFLRQLLPKDFDTSDLMIVLLLLLMAGDNPEEQSNALLTLALYLFM